jgi:hypothetical protein
MIGDDEKTPSILTPLGEAGKTPRPVFALPPRPPLGRPAGALSVAELREQITREVHRAAAIELEHKAGALRAELAGEVRTATGLAIAALVMSTLAVLGNLAFSRALSVRGVGLGLVLLVGLGGLVGFAGFTFAAAKLGARRATPR